jgi:hypothetical protein
MQDHPSSSTLPFNTNDSETWKAYWKEQGQPWRTEPAIDEERQQQLLSNYQGSVDTERGKYPFKGVRLSRADVEYLLAMEEQKSAELSPLEGKALGGDELKRLRAWIPHFPEVLPAADVREVFLNNRTHLDAVHVGNDQYGYIALADVHWGDVNLTVVDWAVLKRLGDETITRSLKVEEEDTQLGERGLPARAERAVDMLLRAQEVSDVVVSYVMRSPTLTKKIRERMDSSSPAQRETQQQLERRRFRAAVRANRQLAVVLRAQGLSEAADRFAYRAQVLQRRVLWRSGPRFYGSYFFSCFLDVLAGYGYKPGRTLIAYILTILSFAIIAQDDRPYFHVSNKHRTKVDKMTKNRLRFWIIIALIVLATVIAGLDATFAIFQHTTIETHTYTVSAQPTLVINNDTGSITIQRGSTNSAITISAIKYLRAFGIGSPPTIRYNQNGNTVTATVHSNDSFSGLGSNNVDFAVTIPANANLQVHTDTGLVTVNGISGIMSLTTNTGSINATQVTLSGHSMLTGTGGSIVFAGSIEPGGLYQFVTGTGSLNVTLPGNSSFQLEARTNTGSLNNNFVSVNVQHANTIGYEARGNVGASATARVILKTNTGSIDLNKGA